MFTIPLLGALVTRGAEFGEGTGRVSLSEVDCDGTEAHLVQCSFITTHFCTHSQDAGVRCLPPSTFSTTLVSPLPSMGDLFCNH